MAKAMKDEDIANYKEKAATGLQIRFADWLIEKLEIEFPNTKAEAAFREAVRLATALRMVFQASPENKKAKAEKAAAEPAEGNAEKPGKKSKKDASDAPASKPAKTRGKATATTEPADGDTAVAATPAKRGPKKAAARSGAAAPF